MDLIKLNRTLNRLTFSSINIISRIKYFVDLPASVEYRRHNKELKDIHRGETCYVVGNGPSINHMDLSPLTDRYVITVNKMIGIPVYDVLQPQYHCVLDRTVLEQVHPLIQQIIGNNKYDTRFLLHRSAYKRLNSFHHVYYIYNTKLPTGGHIDCDLTRNSSAFINVLPFAVMNAVYMGFKRIVLLGCDFSFFTSRRETHFYDAEGGKDRKESLYQDLTGCSIAIMQYESLYAYCKNHGIELVNCTPGSLLDVIPQKELSLYL